MKNNKETPIISKMQALAKSYAPEWKFSVENPDPGSVLAMLCCDMMQESHKRFNQVLHKHKIQYLNLFDRLKQEPIESAGTYVRFTPVAGVDEPVEVAKGTQLYAETETTGRRIVFETMQSITVTPAQLSAVYATDKRKDCIVELMKQDENAENVKFFAFDLSAENKTEHTFLLAFENAFDHLNKLDLALRIHTLNEEDEEQMTKALVSKKMQLALLGTEENIFFDKVEAVGNCIHLVKNEYMPQKTDLFGKACYVLAFTAKQLQNIEITGVELSFSGSELQAEQIICNGVMQNPEHFSPFGKPMEIYAECGIECEELLARKGAEVTMSFDLSFDVLEQLLPEYETNTNYKIIMRQPPAAPKPVKRDIKADYVLLEYYGENGWKRLIKEENAAMLFNGSKEGAVSMQFTVPEDLVDKTDFPGDYRLRLRLLQAENLYQIPSVQYCPVIEHLRFSYQYEKNLIQPDFACIRNNFEEQDITQQLRLQRSVKLFYNKELEKTAMYFGFPEPIWGTPVSLYFEIENNEDFPLDFTAEYSAPGGFRPIKLMDHTSGMLYSGTMLAIIPKDIEKQTIFGKTMYWLRLVRHDEAETEAELPLIKGIYTNMAQVKNQRTQVETFFVDDIDTAVEIQLDEQEILHAQVYVNEQADTEEEENWVRWEKGSFYNREGRVYEIDLTAGRISFEKNIFTQYQLNEQGPHIKVEYQSYQGAEANVPAGAIHTLTDSIRYITRAENPIAAYGGYDGYNEETSAAMISNMLRTRNRAISTQDYFDLISQVSYGVRRIKCCNGVDQYGKVQEDAITIAVLIEEYNQGSHIFSSVKDQIRKKLLESSSILPLGKTLILSQPYFVQLSVRIWLECERMENAYDLQKEAEQLIRAFIDPLHGGFEGSGWEIGVLPTMQQILAYLKIRLPQAAVTRTVLTAHFGRNEHAVNDEIYEHIKNPFAMAVNGEHIVYVDLKQ